MESATMATRKPFVGGNWKMNLNKDAAMALVEAVAAQVPTGIEVAVYPPFPYLDHVREHRAGSRLFLRQRPAPSDM